MFEKKKLKLETLGEYLEEIRSSLNLSLEEAASQTGIKPKFLADLENGDFSSLPAEVYVLGFLRQLADLYRVETGLLIKQYKKERDIQKQLQKRETEKKGWFRRLLAEFVITPKSVSLGLGLLFVAITLGYIVWQVTSINKAPSLEIYEPRDRQLIKGSFVTVRGKTGSDIMISVNDQNIFVDSQGNFKAQLGISAGPKDLSIVAKNKFDKSTVKTISIIGEDGTGEGDAARAQLKVEFFGDVTFSFAVDDAPAQTASFHNGEVKTFSGKRKIVISTSDAGATSVSFNGQALGALGRSGENLPNISFFAESGNINSGGQ